MKRSFHSLVLLWLLLAVSALAEDILIDGPGGAQIVVWTVGVDIDVRFVEREATSTAEATSAFELSTSSTAQLIDPFLEKVGMPASEVANDIWETLVEMNPDYADPIPFSNGLQTFNFSIVIRTTESWVIGEIHYEGPATPVSVTTGVSWKSFLTTRGRRNFYESVAGAVWERVAVEKFVSGSFEGSLRLTYSPSLDEYPSFDPSGRYLAFISDRIGGNRNVHVWDLAMRKIMNFPVYGSSEYFPRFSPDGRYILFQGTMYGQWDLFVMPFSKNYATGIRLITRDLPNAYTPNWYDEKTVLAAVDKGNGADVYAIDIHTGKARNLTKTPDVYEMYPCRVTSGDSFIFVKLKEDGSYGVFERDISDTEGDDRPFLDGPFNEFDPCVSKSGRFLVYTANSDPNASFYRIWVKNLITGEATSVSQTLPYDCYYPTISPDDRYIVFAAYYPDGEPDLWVVENPYLAGKVAGR